MSLISHIESLLYVASKPLTPKEIARALGVETEAVQEVLPSLRERFNTDSSGIFIFDNGSEIQMVTNPANSEAVERFTTAEMTGELTRAQLETLTVVAYQGPITRPELEQIRGVNCAVIIRNLQLRGLVEEEESVDKLVASYRLSVDALRYLGVSSVEELDGYAELHNHEYVERLNESVSD